MGGTSSKDISAKENINKSTPSIKPQKLPAELQKIVDEDDTLFEQIYDGKCVIPHSIPMLHFFLKR